MDNRPLHTKALEVAISDIKCAMSPDVGNRRYLKWKCFHDNVEFMKAVRERKQFFDQKEQQ